MVKKEQNRVRGGLYGNHRLVPAGIAVISVLVILPVVAVMAMGILMLARSKTLTEDSQNHQAIARSNARLALNYAFGQLQFHLGPDARVSANAAIFDQDVSSPEVSGVAHPHWTGVWETQDADQQWLIRRDDRNLGLRDQRGAAGGARNMPNRWLVSGGDQISALDGNAPNGVVPMVANGSLDQSRLQQDRVDVPRVNISANESMAWWVGDLGQRAKVQALSAEEQNNAPAQGWGTPPTADLGAIDPALDNAVDSQGRTLSLRSLELSAGEMVTKRHFHSLTLDGYGVLTNTRDGGLKQDLTQYLNTASAAGRARIMDLRAGAEIISRGLQDGDHLVGPGNRNNARQENLSWGTEYRSTDTGPRFGLLRDWYQQGMQARGSGARSMQPVENARNFSWGTNRGAPVNFEGATSMPFQPIITEAVCSFTIGTYQTQIQNPRGAGLIDGWQLMMNLFPRISMWNPHNERMEVPRLAHFLHISGGKPIIVQTRSGFSSQEFNDRRYTSSHSGAIKPPGGNSSDNPRIFDGHYYFATEAVTLEPGECLSFIPAGVLPYETNPETVDIMQHLLVPSIGDPLDRFFFHGGLPITHDTTASIGLLDQDTGRAYERQPVMWRPNPQQTLDEIEDKRLITKIAPQSGSLIGTNAFRNQPLLSLISVSASFGSVFDAPLEWADTVAEPIDRIEVGAPQLVTPPNFRTVEGLRLRWFDETPSNKLTSGRMEPRHLQIASLATWNPRAVHVQRNPWDNTATLPPFHHGSYINDLADPLLSPSFNQPIPGPGGRPRANPFGLHQESAPSYVLYDFPNPEQGVVSLGALQHVNLSPYSWHPGSPIGNSWADPRVPAIGTAPDISGANGGWNQESLGSYRTHSNAEALANLGRSLAQRLGDDNHLIYDLSFEVNDRLWDRFFLSGATPQQLRQFVEQGENAMLPNPRLIEVNWAGQREPGQLANIPDFHKWGLYLGVDGAFNVNSTNAGAWAAMLRSVRQMNAALGGGSGGETSFSRLLTPSEQVLAPTGPADQPATFDGRRVLTDEEVNLLAEAIVREVKLRGPFLSLGDFVNRRLVDDDTGLLGTLQAAIEFAGVNTIYEANGSLFAIDRAELSDTRINHPRGPEMANSRRLDQARKPASAVANAPGFLTQADILQAISPALSARSDAFVIRGYGESRNAAGEVMARAWCEAIAQRTPEPVVPSSEDLPLNHALDRSSLGRRFRMNSFRWLADNEV